jgi:hypothetical protein
MWMIDKRALCRKHLLGEHNECHAFLGSMRKKIKMDGYIRNNLLEPNFLQENHDQLEAELIRRGYNHKSKLEVKEEDLNYLSEQNKNYEINKDLSLNALLSRCSECKERYEKLGVLKIDENKSTNS